jgi:3-dehydroquinate synthase
MAKTKKPARKPARPATKPAARPASRPASPRPSAAKPVRLRASVPATPAKHYDVLVGHNILSSAAEGLLRDGAGAVVVVDANVARDTLEPLLRTLDNAKARWGVAVVTAREADKSLLALEHALVEMSRIRLERGGLVVAVGGGIAGDLAGFAASIYRRGVAVVQCPTTLLAMVDASVGGKTGANLTAPGPDGKPRLIKNAVGTFHQPARVVCDVAALRTLPEREFACGLAECVKHGLIGGAAGDAKLLAWTAANAGLITARDEKTIATLVARNVALKARVVAKDPFEERPGTDGGRMMLNLGHTFAHVFETLPGLSWRDAKGTVQVGPLKHGEAVGLGLLCAARAAAAMKLAPAALEGDVRDLLRALRLPTRISGLPSGGAVPERMLDDKKTAGAKLRLVLPTKGLRCKVVTGLSPKVVEDALGAVAEGA